MKNKKVLRNENSHSPHKRNSTIWIIISIVVIAACAFVIIDALQSLENTPSADEFVSEINIETELPTTEITEENNSNIKLTPYELSTVNCASLSAIIALAEARDQYETTPAYIFIGQMIVPEAETDDAINDRVEEETEDASKNEDELKLQRTSLSELIRVARDSAEDWNIPYEELGSFLSECIFIYSDKYILIIGEERYAPLAKVFEAAVEDPTVLDLEDLISRLMAFELEG